MRIEQANLFMNEVVRNVTAGRMAPAAFQRPYVWEAEDVEAMFKSVLRRWPLGSFLVWEPSKDVDVASISRGRLGPIEAATDTPYYDFGLILDGQNRLATFAWAAAQFNGKPLPDGVDWSEAERRTWLAGMTLAADAETKSIRFVPGDEALSATRMPLGAVLQHRTANETIRKMDKEFGGLSDDTLRWFGDEVPSCINEARVQCTRLQNATVEEAREAFLHICKVGRPMDPLHLEAALGWAPEEPPEDEPEAPPAAPRPRFG